MRDMDNHDTVTDWPRRAEAVAGHDGMELIEALNYAIDGVPMVYCGNELADTARLSMFANRFYMGSFEVTDRNDKSSPHSLRRQDVIRRLGAMRSQSDTLCFGTTSWLDTDDNDKIICFERALGDEKIIFIGNISKDKTMTEFSAKNYEILAESALPPVINDGKIELEAYGYTIFKTRNEV